MIIHKRIGAGITVEIATYETTAQLTWRMRVDDRFAACGSWYHDLGVMLSHGTLATVERVSIASICEQLYA